MSEIQKTSEYNGFEEYYFSCECSTDEHTIRFTYDKEDGDLYMSVFLHHRNAWYQRIWIALKYVFGYKCKYGHFDNTLVRKDDAGRLIALLEKFRAHKD